MNKLKELRENKGLTQKGLSEATGISLRTLQKYETGERDIAKAEAATVVKIARLLGMTVEDLVEV